MQAVRLNFNSKTSFCGDRASSSHFQPMQKLSNNLGNKGQQTDGKNGKNGKASNARLGDWG